MTRRGRAVVMGVAMVVSVAAGMTAQLWDPYTRHLDSVTVEHPTR